MTLTRLRTPTNGSPNKGYTNGTGSPSKGYTNGNSLSMRRNSFHAGWIVQKYGGTSVGKMAENIAEIVQSYTSDHRVAIVCSARSGNIKAEGTTSRLLRAASESLIPESKAYIEVVDQIQDDHVKEAKLLIRTEALRDQLVTDIQLECSKLKKFLSAAQVINEISPRSKDVIIGAGEKLSCRLMTALLVDRGIDAEYVNLESIIPADYQTEWRGLRQEFYDYLATRLAKRVRQCGDRVPVITGFFGQVPGSILDTIGRGYTDLCAALVAVGLDADELQVWKEVDGIFTADPRKVPNARLLPTITPEEAAELTYYGSEVIHPYTMEQVIRASIPIRIKNVENPDGEGTIIFPDDQRPRKTGVGMPKLLRVESSVRMNKLIRRRATAVTIKNSILILNIHSNRKSLSHGFFANIFSTLDKYQLVVDLISTSEVHVSMALHADIREKDLSNIQKELEVFGSVDTKPDMTILSLVGKHMKNMKGVAGKMFTVLAQSNINIEMISQGASEINISCVIEEKDAVKALRVIHDKVLEEIVPENENTVLQNKALQKKALKIEESGTAVFEDEVPEQTVVDNQVPESGSGTEVEKDEVFEDEVFEDEATAV